MPVWDNIRPRLLAILEEECLERERRRFEATWAKRSDQLGALYKNFLRADHAAHGGKKRLMPNFADARELPCMRDLLTSADPNDEITGAQFSAIESALVEESGGYQRRVMWSLVRLAMPVSSVPPHLQPEYFNVLYSDQEAPELSIAATSPDSSTSSSEEDRNSLTSYLISELRRPTTLFRCYCTIWNVSSERCNYSHTGIIEHYSTAHFDRTPWMDDCVHMGRCQSAVPFLLDSLKMPERTTHDSLEKRWDGGKVAVCSCGKRFTPTERCEMLGLLVRLTFTAAMARRQAHHRRTIPTAPALQELDCGS